MELLPQDPVEETAFDHEAVASVRSVRSAERPKIPHKIARRFMQTFIFVGVVATAAVLCMRSWHVEKASMDPEKASMLHEAMSVLPSLEANLPDIFEARTLRDMNRSLKETKALLGYKKHADGTETVSITPLNAANCYFNVAGAMGKLAQGGLSLNAAVATCGWGDIDKYSEACTANIAGFVAAYVAAGNLLASAVATCDPNYQSWKAGCSSAILTLISSLSGITATTAGMINSCPSAISQHGATVFSPISVSEETALAACIVNANDAALALGTAGLKITAADMVCDTSDAACAGDVTSALGAFAAGGLSLTGAIAKCDHGSNPLEGCAAFAQGLFANVMGVAHFASVMAGKACEGDNSHLKPLYAQVAH